MREHDTYDIQRYINGGDGISKSFFEFELAGTLLDSSIDELISLIKRICDADYAGVSMINEKLRIFRDSDGVTSLTAHEGNEISDYNRPLQGMDEKGIRSCIGMPLSLAKMGNVGSLCLAFKRAIKLSDVQMNAVKLISKHIEAHLEKVRILSLLRHGNFRMQST